MEQTALDWLRKLMGLPSEYVGFTYDGGSASNLHALIAARQYALGEDSRGKGLAGLAGTPVIYASELTHSSIAKAAIAIGIGSDNVREIEIDDRGSHAEPEPRRILADSRQFEQLS